MPEKRKKLLWQIFPLFLFITIISLVAVTWYSTTFFKKFFLENSEQELTIRAELVKSVVKGETFTKTDALCKVIGKKTGTRVTVILPTGVVIGDSFGIISGMENHRTRPEVGLALKGERGVSVRYSDTVEKNMMYIALPLFKNGQISSIVRVAVSVSTIDNEIKNIQKNIFWALIITVFAAAGISLFVSRRITRPIEEMNSSAHYFAKGDLTRRLAIPDSRELAKLAITMNQMAETLDEKIKTVNSRSMELEAVYTSMRDGVMAVDRDEKIITFNRAAAKIFDVPASTLKGKNIHGITRNYDLQKFLKKALNNASTFEDDIVIQRDKEYLFHVHSTPLYNIWKKQMGTLIIFHDITRIRHLETMQKDFAANVSHELKTPLTSVKGFVETLQDLMEEKEFSKNGLSFLTIIEKNVNRLIALIDDLLVLSKLERKQGGDIVFQRHDITQIISRAVDTCQREIDQREVAILGRYLKADSCKTLTAPVD
ncbi:MAG: histidine kinase dimerization/phospho-acceptor domain-containing protein, partial [Thermodesulfobacteriota bacterium]|nr:histidine kinase dimerization/phospho-acceptor domain-containing protein [Thermodesulfobacteriota bacterium]